LGVSGDGKRIRRSVYGWTKKEVQDGLAKLQGHRFDGTLTQPGKTTLAAFLTRWLDDVARLAVRARTLDNYRRSVEKHISPLIGGVKLDKLCTAQIEWLYAEMERNGVGCHTRRLCHAVLRQALKKAVRWNLVSRNACDGAEPPCIKSKEIQPLTAVQAGALLAAARGDRQEALYVLAVTGGMRLGELFGLQWSDVDLESGAIHVRHALQELNGKLELTEPKTAKSRRKIELGRLAIDALLDHRKRQLAAGRLASGYVFTNTDGGPLRRSHFHRANYKPLLTKAGLPDIRFHDLRHTAATLLLMSGVHPKIVADRLGHSKIGITIDLYSHVLPSMQKEAASRIDSLLTLKTEAKAG
jgi:integrase